jgi:hypothetical protein
MKLSKLFLASLLFAVGCVSGTATETVKLDNTVSFSGSPLPVGVQGTLEQTAPVDVSNAVSKLEKYGTLNVSVDQNTITGDISFLTHVKIALENQTASVVVCDTDINTTNTVNNFPVSASGQQLLSILSDSNADLHFWITGSVPNNGATLESTIVISVSDSVSKDL